MNAWNFILGAYLVTLIVAVIEVIVVRASHRNALQANHNAGAPTPSRPAQATRNSA